MSRTNDSFLYVPSACALVKELRVQYDKSRGDKPFRIPLGDGGNSLTFDLESLRTLRYELDTAEALYFEQNPDEVTWDNIPASIRSGLMMPPAVQEFIDGTGGDTPS